MEKLRIRFDNDGDVDLTDVEIYSIGSLLKLFLVINVAHFMSHSILKLLVISQSL